MINQLIKNRKLKIVNCRKGFTLIELLIVIAIIGVLATLLMVNFVGVRQRARDAQRKSDLRQIQSALELYRADNSKYPDLGNGDGQFPDKCGTGVSFAMTGTIYMQTVPCDPLGAGITYTYTSPIPGQSGTYSITACLENASDNQIDVTNLCASPYFSFTVFNP
jgi:general secretion pathway protein G